jgi:DNA repair protein RecO (recombination protein O)
MSRHIISLEPAYVLHTRPYRDTSALIIFFTYQHGLIHAVARGARGNRSRLKGLLQPFVPLLISWSGQNDLHSLRDAEAQGEINYLPSEKFLTGLYINELLVRVLQKHDAHPELYLAYQQALQGLCGVKHEQAILRIFEKRLLHALGYALPLNQDCATGHAILSERFYQFDPAHGFSILPESFTHHDATNVFAGKIIIALQQEDFGDKQLLRDMKRLMRLALAPLIGAKQLKSRELFLTMF